MGAIGLMIAMVLSPTIQTASIGIPDTMFLMVLALIVFGPRRLPEIGRQIGKLMYEFRKVSNDFKFQMEEELRASEEAARQQKLAASNTATLNVPPQPAAFDHVTPTPAIAAQTGLVEPPLPGTIEGVATNAALTTSTVEGGLQEPALPSESEPPLTGEVRGEPRKFPHITPPVSGEPIAAARPFRTPADSAAFSQTAIDTVTDSGDEATLTAVPISIAKAASDEGRIGTEVQPGVNDNARDEVLHISNGNTRIATEEEREARHA